MTSRCVYFLFIKRSFSFADKILGANNTGLENAGLENDGLYSRG